MTASTRRVVLVAPEFAPSNTAGAHRPRLFAKHLPAFGWTPTVLTIRCDLIEGPTDPTLERLVDPALRVVRTGALPVKPLRLIGDLGLRTLPAHATALSELAGDRRVDAIVLFGPPWFSFALGPYARRRLGVPYVLDYIDPWVSEWTASHRFPSKGWFYHHAALSVEPRALRSAAHVTAVSAGILDDLCARFPWLDRGRMTAMPYGAEPDDFAAAAALGIRPPDAPAAGDVSMTFTGALQPSSGPLLNAVFTAIRSLRDTGSSIGRRLRLRCYGTSNLTWGHDRFVAKPAAEARGLGDIVSETPERVPYLQALAALNACDIVLVMGSTDAYYHASKLYPAIVSGKPVLAICHADASISSVMAQTGAGECVTFRSADEIPDTVPAIAAALERLAVRPARPLDPSIDPFTARASTAALARALDAAVGVVRASEAA